MAAISSFMNLYENCNFDIICVESDEEHLSKNQIAISFFINEIGQFLIYDFTSKLRTLFFVIIVLGKFW